MPHAAAPVLPLTRPPAVTSVTQVAPHAGLCHSDTCGHSPLRPAATLPSTRCLFSYAEASHSRHSFRSFRECHLLGATFQATLPNNSGSHSQQTLPLPIVHCGFLLRNPHSSPFAILAFLLHLYLADNLISASRDDLPNSGRCIVDAQ